MFNFAIDFYKAFQIMYLLMNSIYKPLHMKTLSLLLLLSLLMGTSNRVLGQTSAIWNGAIDTTWFTNAPGAPAFEISTPQQLAGLADLVNRGGHSFSGRIIRLAQSIVLNDTVNWQSWATSAPANSWIAIGIGTSRFRGTFDGRGHQVIGVYINRPDENFQGLFGVTEGSTIMNIGVVNSFINGRNFVGGVVGGSGGNISNSYNAGIVNGLENVGGVAGRISGIMSNSYNTGSVRGTYYVGGVAGWNNFGTVTNSFNTGMVNGNSRLGGVVGENGGTVTNSFNSGAIIGQSFVGGVVGENFGGLVTNNYFLSGTATLGMGGGIGSAVSKSQLQLASGEVAHLLQGTQPAPIWGHTLLGGAELPRLNHFAPTARQVRRVSFSSDNPVHNSSRLFLNSDNVVLPSLDRSGYRVVWHDAESKVVTSNSKVVSDLMLTALLTPSDNFVILFHSAGGTAVSAISQVMGTEVTAPSPPTRVGHTFAGWLPAVPATMPGEDIAVTAQWTINPYTITFNSHGGSLVNAITQSFGTEVASPAPPTRVGHTFAGWLPAVPATMPAENITLTAQWTLNQHIITFNSDGGSLVDAITQAFGTMVIAPATPIRTGYAFVGWFPEIPNTMPATDLTLTAQWVPDATSIEAGIRAGFGVTLFPNPAREYLMVSITAAGELAGKTARYSVIDLKGREFASGTILISSTSNESRVDLSRLPAGVGAVVIEIEGVGIKRELFVKTGQ